METLNVIFIKIQITIFFTREQIGTALEYANPNVALSKIHSKHKDKLDSLSVVTKLESTDGKMYETILYCKRGIMEICRWSRQKKANTNLQKITSTQTPIEIALQIDENGMTSLKNLYEFLEINPSNYSKWCKRNIINNPFVTEGIDYMPIRLENENHTGGRPTYDYKLTQILQSSFP